MLLLVPFICLSKRTEKGDDGDGDGGGGAEDDDDRDGVGGRPWRTLGEEQEVEDLQRIEETLGENMGELRPLQRRTCLQFVPLRFFRVLFLLREMQSASRRSFRRETQVST